MTKRIIVTCGPSFEPIDNVRRITNFSTAANSGSDSLKICPVKDLTCSASKAAGLPGPARMNCAPLIHLIPMTICSVCSGKLRMGTMSVQFFMSLRFATTK